MLRGRKLMVHAQEGVEMGLGQQQGAMGVLKHANSAADDVDGSSTAVVAVMHQPNICEVHTALGLYSFCKNHLSFHMLGARHPRILHLLIILSSAWICSMCCMRVLSEPFCFQIASLGDSGFRLIRDGQSIFASQARGNPLTSCVSIFDDHAHLTMS